MVVVLGIEENKKFESGRKSSERKSNKERYRLTVDGIGSVGRPVGKAEANYVPICLALHTHFVWLAKRA